MNKIIYFTNALDQKSFVDYLKKWKVSPNLSNQNFHNKLIKSLSLAFDVEVVSVRAINSNFENSKLSKDVVQEGNIKWNYPEVSTSKVAKLLLLNSRVNKALSLDNSDYVIFVDALNYSLVKAAYKLHKKKGYKIIGVCTDNPFNISFTSNSYRKNLMKYASNLDGYVVLTEGINQIYNLHNKPYIQIDGVSEEVKLEEKNLVEGKYIYFGGSLMEEYGVYSLIDAFLRLKLKDVKLVICGHHLQREKLFNKIGGNESIIYLGPVSYLDNLALERKAILSVNPRPINPKIDDYSIPSKTLECLSIKCLNVTVDNNILKKNYEDVIIWSKSSSPEDLETAISKALSLSENEKEKIIESGYKKVMLRTSQKAISEQLKLFLSKFFLN